MNLRTPKLTRIEFHNEVNRCMADAREKDCLKRWVRYMCKNSLFYLCVYILDMHYVDHDFGYAFCAEIEYKKWGRIWVLAREHFKSTLLTFASTIQDIIINPEERIGIYSYNVTLARDTFVKQIKQELENNEKLKFYFDDIFYQNPKTESPVWTAEAIQVKRTSRAREATVEGSGLVTGQKTGKHYTELIYDDVMTPDSVKTTEMKKYTEKQWQMSLNTGSSLDLKYYVVGTFYAEDELYAHIIKGNKCESVIQPALNTDGTPVFLPMKAIRKKRTDMGPDVWATQMMCDPKGARKDTFKMEWIKYFDSTYLFGSNNFYKGMNVYLFVDPAGTLSRKRDFTAMWVIGLASDHNYYILDLYRDKMNLSMKKRKVFEIHNQYHPRETFYEKVGMQSDIDSLEEDMERLNYRFHITEIGASIPKNLRIEATQPLFEQGKFYFPKQIIHENWEGVNEDMLKSFFEQEYKTYPVGEHDDGFDSLSMVVNKKCNPYLVFPDAKTEDSKIKEYYKSKQVKKKPTQYDPLSAVM